MAAPALIRRGPMLDAGADEPVGDQSDCLLLTLAIEMVAVGYEREFRRTSGPFDKGFAGIDVLSLSITAQEQHGAAHLRC